MHRSNCPMNATISSTLKSSVVRSNATLLPVAILLTFPSNHDMAVVPMDDTFFSIDAFFKFFNAASLACKNATNCGTTLSSGCDATRRRKRSNARRRVSTNSCWNRPTACLSGNAGMMAPGTVRLNSVANHAKSLYRRTTITSPYT